MVVGKGHTLLSSLFLLSFLSFFQENVITLFSEWVDAKTTCQGVYDHMSCGTFIGKEREVGVPCDTWRHVCANLGEDMWEHKHVVVQGQLTSGKASWLFPVGLGSMSMLFTYLTVLRVIL